MPQKRSKREWEKIEGEWRESGRPIEAFSKCRHISPTAFRHYLTSKQGDARPPKELPFVELIDTVPRVKEPGRSVTMCVDARVRIELEPDFDEKILVSVLRTLGIVV